MKKELNIWGMGYVNVNDIEIYRRLNVFDPYVKVSHFINQHCPRPKKWEYINPPPAIY
jgi:hypothetical protein